VVFVFLVALVVVLEGAKALGGDPWRFTDAAGNETVYRPPFSWPIVSDLSLPHVWKIWDALAAPVQRQQQQSLAGFLVGAALYTGREAALGFLVGGLLGLALAAFFVHSKLAERAFMPYIVASQTIPILALAPLIAFAFGNGLVGIVIVASYLTFFPVTIAQLRGLTSPDPRAVELMRSCAASRRSRRETVSASTSRSSRARVAVRRCSRALSSSARATARARRSPSASSRSAWAWSGRSRCTRRRSSASR
jgi:ABC-type Na+ efflux pump permease subunit